jgi:hypothetical protein
VEIQWMLRQLESQISGRAQFCGIERVVSNRKI